MESGDGGWIRAGATQPGADDGLGREPGSGGDDGWPDDEWTEDGWPAAAAAEPAAGPLTGPLTGKRWSHGGVPGFSVWVAAAVAVVAAAAGVAAGFLLVRGTPSASAAAGATPSASASARPGQVQIALTGRVLAISRTSITIGGEGPSVTAAVTGATTVTGRAHGIGGVKAGDEVSAQLTGTTARLTAAAIQDPASV